MFEQDYIMRLIKEMVRTLLKLIFNIDAKTPTVKLLENAQEREYMLNLLDMIEQGNINEAENCLYDIVSSDDRNTLKLAF